ncbi:hypothetical protein PAEPH01_2083 [Pancytospora epiphaga]|nr:hypothetical protein PAEPH01_2083 [Pancytospora epiphaga]
MNPMIEINSETKRGFAYGTEAVKLLEKICGNTGYVTDRIEKIESTLVYIISGIDFKLECPREVSLLNIGPICCLHGTPINYQSINRLPHDGWEELIDCWSCHKGEFKSMVNLEIKPRKGGILVSDFYMIADKGVIPSCCGGVSKIYYNNLIINYSAQTLLYLFFNDYFQSKSLLVIEQDGVTYEIKYFYNCLLLSDAIRRAIKVGIKITDKNADTERFLNTFYIDQIIKELTSTATNTKVLGYDLAFIREV